MMIDSDNICSDDDPDDVGCWIVDRETHSLSFLSSYGFFFGR